MFKHLLVPLSGDSHNHALVEAACQFAKSLKALITFYHAQPSYFPPLMAAETLVLEMGAVEQYNKAMDEQSLRLLKAAMAIAERDGIACNTHCQLQDSPYLGIIETVKQLGCDLIFMASHGRSGIGAVLLGSQTQKVLAHSTVPILVYREAALAEMAPQLG